MESIGSDRIVSKGFDGWRTNGIDRALGGLGPVACREAGGKGAGQRLDFDETDGAKVDRRASMAALGNSGGAKLLAERVGGGGLCGWGVGRLQPGMEPASLVPAGWGADAV